MKDHFSDRDIASLYPHPYKMDGYSLFITQYKNGAETFKKLCNFMPYIIEEDAIDDGAEIARYVMVTGIHEDGKRLPKARVPASDIAGTTFNWIIENWGAKCNIEPRRNVKDNIRHALQSTAANVPCRTIYKHFGWKKINSQWEFLMPGKTFDVKAEGKLKSYHFEDKDADLSARASLDFLFSQYAPNALTYPLMAYIYLTPLNHFLKEAGCEPKITLCLIGKTGTKKSTLAALALSHFGSFTNVDLPLSFRDTANSIIKTAFMLKDVLTVIDDFHPSTKSEELSMNTTAQMITRAYGDRVGRSRLRSDSSLMIARPPQGNAIITAEQSPDITESGLERTIQLEIKEGDIKLNLLSEMQIKADQGLLSSAMRNYIEWIKGKFLVSDEAHKKFIENLSKRFKKSREHYISVLSECGTEYHARLPEVGAWLDLGLLFAFHYFMDMNLIDESMGESHMEYTDELITELIIKQATAIRNDRPSIKFIAKLGSLIVSGKAKVISKDNWNNDKPIGFIGYEDHESYYLITDVAHSMVKRLCEEQGEVFSTSVKSMLKHLSEDGYIDANAAVRTKVIRIGETTRRYLVLSKTQVESTFEKAQQV